MPIGHRVVFVVIGTHISPPKKTKKGTAFVRLLMSENAVP